MCSRHLVLQPTEEWATSSKVVWDSVRKWGEQTLRDKPLSGTPGLCLSSCHQALPCLPLMMNHNCMFGGGVDLSNRSQGEQLGLALLPRTLTTVWISSPRVCSLAPRDPIIYCLLVSLRHTHRAEASLSWPLVGLLGLWWDRCFCHSSGLALTSQKVSPTSWESLTEALGEGLGCLWRPPTPT